MKNSPSKRISYLIGFIFVIALLSFGLYLEEIDGITPCPLCILQRICLGALGLVFLLGVIINPKKIANIFISMFALLCSIAGAILSGRQVWLQHNASGLNSNCDVSFQYMIQAMPLDEVMKRIFHGGTECSQVSWQFLQMSLAEWSFICFILFSLFSFWMLIRK